MKTNSNNWIKFFQKYCAYRPLEVIRKDAGYLGKQDFSLALALFGEHDAPCSVRLIFPFGSRNKPSDSIAVFPQVVPVSDDEFYEIEETILYDGQMYSLSDFAKKAPPLADAESFNQYDFYSLPIELFIYTTDEFNKFKKDHLNPIRDMIIETGYFPQNQGANKDIGLIRERDGFILSVARELNGTRGFSYLTIESRVRAEAVRRYPNRDTDKDEAKNYKRFACAVSTIRSVLKGKGKFSRKK